MKTFFKSLVVAGVVLVALLQNANAQLLSSHTFTNGVSAIKREPVLIYALQLNNPNAAAVTVKLYDNDSGTSTNTVKAAYSTWTWTRATNSVVITNVFGNLQTNNFIYLSNVEVEHAAITNEATLLYPPITVPAAGSANVTFNSPLATGLGLNALTLSSNITGFLSFRPLP